ncbi:MAG: dTMP kinase [Alistipes sp.]|nr:dTMP kinase [Alistipes sp.]
MFIVLEGLDGAGKSTQIKKLRELFAERGVASEYVHFPRFDAPFYGDLIARFLRGELGSVEQVDPYVVALLYAGDRADMAKQIEAWQAEGKVVIADRYVYSNIGYQCAKIADKEARERLRQWILSLEYEYNKIPRPDVSLFLDVPFAFTEKRLTEQREGDDRTYLNGGSDIHEQSLSLQERVREVYISSARCDAELVVVDCSDADGTMATPDEIFSRIENSISPLLNGMNNGISTTK